MKKVLILIVMLICVLALGFSQTTISGIYRYDTNNFITFTSNYFTASGGGYTFSGTFSISGSRITCYLPNGTVGLIWTIVDANIIRDQDGNNWRKESGGTQAQSGSFLDFQLNGAVMNGTELVMYIGNSTNVTIPAGVTAIGLCAFQGRIDLTSISIPSSVTSIDQQAFHGCTSLTNITIPSSVTSVGISAFEDWTSSQTINVEGHANQASADAAWGRDWRDSGNARINYRGR